MDKLGDNHLTPSVPLAPAGIITDWKATFLGIAARGQTLGFFARCLRLLDSGMSEEVRRLLSSGRWKQGVDYVGVPPAVLERTDELCARALLSLEAGEMASVAEVLEGIMDGWY